jgi:hypothetical protein
MNTQFRVFFLDHQSSFWQKDKEPSEIRFSDTPLSLTDVTIKYSVFTVHVKIIK